MSNNLCMLTGSLRYTDCNGIAKDGCEINTAADINNCGTCGNKLSLANVATPTCVNGQPAIAPDACSPG
jgi:hypothetical protein